MTQDIIDTPIGKIKVYIAQNALEKVDLMSDDLTSSSSSDSTLLSVRDQLLAYFEDPCYQFNLPLKKTGTVFQNKVWTQLKKIPCGKTVTYNELAKQLNTSPRAIGNACRTNPCPLIIPCHRVVAQQGLGGYMGYTKDAGLEKKRWLLQHEKAL